MSIVIMDGMPEFDVQDYVKNNVRIVEVYVPESDFSATYKDISRDWLPDDVNRMIRRKYRDAKEHFTNGMYSEGC